MLLPVDLWLFVRAYSRYNFHPGDICGGIAVRARRQPTSTHRKRGWIFSQQCRSILWSKFHYSSLERSKRKIAARCTQRAGGWNTGNICHRVKSCLPVLEILIFAQLFFSPFVNEGSLAEINCDYPWLSLHTQHGCSSGNVHFRGNMFHPSFPRGVHEVRINDLTRILVITC